MESFTHESDESSSCTQSDGDSTNSSNGPNPFLLCPRGNSLQVGGHGRPHDNTEDTRPFKLARLEPPSHRQYHASVITNPQSVAALPYPHNVMGTIHGSDGLHNRSYVPSALDDCRGLPPQVASAARPPHGGLPYLGATQNFFTQDQWTGLRQQTYVLKHVAAGNTPSSALLLPMSCKVEKMPINFGNNSGSFYVGLADPQPGRCRRTDGKKWRCGRPVVPEQKYCERHMHRGRGRSKAAKLAKLTTPVDTVQPHNSGRPLNQPLIQLLSQLTVPVQPLSQPPDTVQQPPVPAQPLKWLQKSTHSFQQPHAHLPYLAQPLVAEPLSQLPIQSKPLDWPINQSPMQAEPLNLVQSNGRPPILAQAIPMTVVSEVKVRPDPTNGSAIAAASRVLTSDPNDVFTLDVQGIKRLLDNAPCSMRARSSASKQKQLPNVADLLNVAHIRNLNSQPKKPPSLMDILKMVEPGTNTSTRTGTISHRQLPNTAKDSVVPADRCQTGQGSSAARHTGTLLSLTWSDKLAAEEQNKQYRSNLSGSLGLLTAQPKQETVPLKLFKVKCEGGAFDHDKPKAARLRTDTEGECLQSMASDDCKRPSSNSTEGCASQPASLACRTTETAKDSQSQLTLSIKESQNYSGSPVNLLKTDLNLIEERNQSAVELKEDGMNLADGHFKSVEGSSRQRLLATLDINSSTLAEEGCDHHTSLIEQERSKPSSRKEASNHQERCSKSESGSLILLEGSLDSCASSGKSEGFLPSLVEKSLDQHGGSESPDTSSPISMKKRVDQHESCANLDMNSPVLVVEVDVCQHGNPEHGKTITSSTLPIEILQTKAAFDRSSSDSSCNASSFSKSTLSLDPTVLSNPEPSSQVSLAN